MKAVKIALIALGCLIAAFVIFAVACKIILSQGVIEPYEMGNPKLKTRVLIGSQGSDFKKELTARLAAEIAQKGMYVKVIDVTTLAGIQEQSWNAIVLITTIEMYKLQKDVLSFLNAAKDKDKIVMLASSSDGNMMDENSPVDGITSGSGKGLVDEKYDAIMAKLEPLLAPAVPDSAAAEKKE